MQLGGVRIGIGIGIAIGIGAPRSCVNMKRRTVYDFCRA